MPNDVAPGSPLSDARSHAMLEAAGPIIVWTLDPSGYQDWWPLSFDTMEDAIDKVQSEGGIITLRCDLSAQPPATISVNHHG